MLSFVASLGEEDGGNGVTLNQWAWWMRRWRFITTLLLSEEEEVADGVKSREEMRIGEDGRDIGLIVGREMDGEKQGEVLHLAWCWRREDGDLLGEGDELFILLVVQPRRSSNA